MEYSECPPSAALASIVRCIWTLDGHAADLREAIQPVLPDGCPELVMHFGDVFERLHENGSVERQPAILVAGQLTRQLALRPTGRIAVVGIRFHPDGAAAILDVPQHRLAGLTIGIDAVSTRLFQSLNDVLESTASPAAAISAVMDRLAAHAHPERIDERVRYAVDAIGRHRGRVSIDRLARHLALTRRHLERRFKARVGISPKRLARIVRFQRALRMLQEFTTTQRGTRTAMTCGYADQAHFVREFRQLAGCPPGAHLLRDAQLAGFFAGQ